MAKVVVVLFITNGREKTNEVVGDSWNVGDGVLTVVDEGRNPVATYAAGSWLSVRKEG